MKRNWAVRPDPDTGIADRQQIIEALMDGEALLHRAGGVLSIVVHRAPTDLDGEMVTVAAVFEWKDRTDGHVKAQPERLAAALPVQQPDPTPAELEQQLEAEATGEAAFLEQAERDEDLSSMGASAA